MIVKLARKTTRFLCKNGIVPEEDFEVYSYSFEVLISTVINSLLLLIVALITNTFLRSFAFAVCFFCLRRVCGGGHAKTHFVCISSMMLIYCVFLILSPHISINLPCLLILSCAEIAIMFFLAPVEDFNKPLSADECKKYGKQSRAFVLVAVVLSFIMFQLNYAPLAIAIQFSLVTVCALLIFGKLKNLIIISRNGK